jgi:hypothetical protein
MNQNLKETLAGIVIIIVMVILLATTHYFTVGKEGRFHSNIIH